MWRNLRSSLCSLLYDGTCRYPSLEYVFTKGRHFLIEASVLYCRLRLQHEFGVTWSLSDVMSKLDLRFSGFLSMWTSSCMALSSFQQGGSSCVWGYFEGGGGGPHARLPLVAQPRASRLATRASSRSRASSSVAIGGDREIFDALHTNYKRRSGSCC